MGIPPVSPPFYTHPARTMPRQTLLGALIVSLLAVSAQDADQDVNTDCTCACAASSSAAKTEYHIAVGSEAACTPAKCIDERAECTAGGLVEATYHDCTCHCCNVGQCQNGMQPYPFKVDFPEQCTAAKCASEFYQCPNDPNLVEATYAGVVPSPSPPPNAADVPPPPPSPPPPPTSPKSLVLADYESSAGRNSVLTAFVTIFMFL